MKKTAARIALLVAGLAVGGLLAEVVVRATGAARPAELDELFDRPPITYSAPPERAHPWTSGQEDFLRVAVVGDSFTVGEGNHGYDAFPARLEHLLNLNPGVRPAAVEVYAAKGTSTEGQFGFLLEALRDRSELVIVAVVLNDTETWLDPSVRERREAGLPRVPEGRTLALVRRSHAARLAYHRLERARAQRALLTYYRHNFDPGYVGWARFNEALGYFAGHCRRQGVPLVAVVFPGMFRLEEGLYPFRYAHERISGALAEASIPHLDLLDLFLGKSELRLAAQPGIDGHPSEIAHRLAADAIFGYLLDTGVLAADYRPRLATRLPREQSLRAARRMLTPTALAE